MKRLVLTIAAAGAFAAFAKDGYVDPNPYAKYGPAMSPNPQHQMAIEFDVNRRPVLDAATAPEKIAAILESDEAVNALLLKVKPNYRTCPVAACQIAACSQYVMGSEPWYAFWRTGRCELRRRWVGALLKFIRESDDDYVREYLLDQLRWCGCPNAGAKALASVFDASENVRAMAAMVARELADASDAKAYGCPFGTWGLYLPFPTMKAGHLILSKDDAGQPQAKLLWRWASPFDVEHVALAEGGFKLRFGNHKAKDLPQDKGKWRDDVVEAKVFGDAAVCSYYKVDGFGKKVTPAQTFVARRNPPVGPAPELDKLVWGQPINLLSGSMDDFELMGAGKQSGWTLKDGVLSNRIARGANGKSLHQNGNLRTKRADFRDFKLSYDVRVLPGCNSGVYLRGLYEIQVLDSYGKPVDCHNMAAYYGRVCPAVAAEKPAGEWQHVDVILCRCHLTVTLNGKRIIDNVAMAGITGGAMTPDEFAAGPLYIQGDHSDADFRNMVLTPIVP